MSVTISNLRENERGIYFEITGDGSTTVLPTVTSTRERGRTTGATVRAFKVPIGKHITGTVVAGGTGYANGDKGTISGGDGTAHYTVLTNSAGVVQTVSVQGDGSFYADATASATTHTTGSGNDGLTLTTKTAPLFDQRSYGTGLTGFQAGTAATATVATNADNTVVVTLGAAATNNALYGVEVTYQAV